MTRRKYSTVTLVGRNSYLAKPLTPLVREAITAPKCLRLEPMDLKRISLADSAGVKGIAPVDARRVRIVFDCRTTNDQATITRESTNENNTDVNRWADARRLRINGKPCSEPWHFLNLPARFAGSR